MAQPMRSQLLRLACVAVIYFLAARLGLTMDAVGGVATTVWPPTAIALSALLLFGYGLWPGIALAAFLVNLSVGVPILGALGMAAGNTLEAVIATYLLRRGGFQPALERLRDAVSLVVCGGLLSTLVSASVGVTSGWLTGVIGPADYGSAWRSWWVGDMLSDLVLAPVLLTWGSHPRVQSSPWRLAEAFSLAGLILILSLIVFGYDVGLGPADFLQPYFLFPLFIWVALRFDQRGVAAAILAVSVVAIGGTAQGYGPFARQSVNESLLFLQTFMGVLAVTFLVLAAVVAEHSRAEAGLREAHDQLELRVEERTVQLKETNDLLYEEILERKRAEEEIHRLNENLKRRAVELEAVNRELESFSYSVSHDLRAPVRRIEGFSSSLLEEYEKQLGEKGRDYLRRIRASCEQMARLIEDLLQLSRVTRSKMHREPVDLSALARQITVELQKSDPGRRIQSVIGEGLVASGDARLLRVALENLLVNAWKFTGKRDDPRIEFGVVQMNGQPIYYVRDNGVGFDMAYADRLFGAFQRLHEETEFPGTGIGLATVQRIIHRHGGRVWAESAVGQGATFYFTL